MEPVRGDGGLGARLTPATRLTTTLSMPRADFGEFAPYERLLHPSRLYHDFLYDPARVAAFYPVDFRDLGDVAARAIARRYPEERRAEVSRMLTRQAERYGVAGATRDAIARFARPGTLAVVAGQQPGLFGGPIYTLYKALTAIAYARSLEHACGGPVVPIFWIASDDHDFEEVRHARLGTSPNGAVELEIPLDAVPRHVSVARIVLGAEMTAARAALERAMPSGRFRDEAVARLGEAYAEGRCWSEAFARWMAGLLGAFGAIVFDAADESAKTIALPIFEREIERAGRSAAIAHDTGEALVRLGYHAQIARAGDELNLFWHGEEREAVRLDGGARFHLAGSGRGLTAAELKRLVRAQPRDASPGVLLRPLVQDHLFPTAAYVGGPAEVAYWAQINAIYPLFDMAPPAIVPRAGATLLEAPAARALDRFRLSWTDLAGDPEALITGILRATLPDDFPARFEGERRVWRESFERLERAVRAFDPSLEAATRTAAGKLQHEGDVLEKKLLHVWKRRQEETVDQLHRAHDALFPGGALQERAHAFLPYLMRHGTTLIERLGAELGEPGSHRLISLTDRPA